MQLCEALCYYRQIGSITQSRSLKSYLISYVYAVCSDYIPYVPVCPNTVSLNNVQVFFGFLRNLKKYIRFTTELRVGRAGIYLLYFLYSSVISLSFLCNYLWRGKISFPRKYLYGNYNKFVWILMISNQLSQLNSYFWSAHFFPPVHTRQTSMKKWTAFRPLINVKTAISHDFYIRNHYCNINNFLESGGKRLLMINIMLHFFGLF